jgi:hypothetical protein
MRYFIISVFFLTVNLLFSQNATLTDASQQETSLEISRYEIRSGQLILFDNQKKPMDIPIGEGNSIVLGDDLRFQYFNYSADKLTRSGYFQQLTTGEITVYDLGQKGLLVKDSNSGDLRHIPLSSNKAVLTYLLRDCAAITAESLNAVNTNGLTNLLTQLNQYNICIAPSTARILYKEKTYKTKIQVGPLVGVKSSELNPLNRESTLREGEGNHIGPVLGVEARKKLGRSRFGLQGQLLISQTNIKNDSFPIPFNNNTYQTYEFKGLNLQLNVLGTFQLRRDGFLTSLMAGFSPRLNLNQEFSREAFGTAVLLNDYVGRKTIGVGIVGGIGLYEKRLDAGGLLSFQLQADSYKQYLDFSDGTTPGYREIKWSLFAGYLF